MGFGAEGAGAGASERVELREGEVELMATTSFGLEAIVAREIQALGYGAPKVEDGRVTFRGPLSAICRANLWLRSAERVVVKMAEFEARDFGELFDQTKSLPWADWIPVDGAFPVRGRSVRSQLHSVPDCQAIVKKAVVESLRGRYQRNWFAESGPEYPIEVSMLRDRATLTIDTSGSGLHKRGYRTLVGPAPLKETLAAALVQLSFWKPDRVLADPFCGTGTIPIEAALWARNIAPGSNRTFAAESWPRLPRQLWTEARTEARDLKKRGPQEIILASDRDPDILKLATHHARAAGVEHDIHFQHRDVIDFASQRTHGCIICNPPYGERVGTLDEVEELYRDMGEVFAALDTWSIYVLTSHPRFEAIYDRPADRRRKLYNGRIECTYYQMIGPPPAGRSHLDMMAEERDLAPEQPFRPLSPEPTYDEYDAF